MLNHFLSYLEVIEDFVWTYGGAPALMFVGIYFTYKSNFFQIINMPKIFKIFCSYFYQTSDDARGIRPIYVFFASIGGCIGIGNVVGVCTAVQLGGPGAVFWMWVAGFFGMLVKYAEIYLGMIYRKKDKHNSYIGGPMIYLQQLQGGKILSSLVAFLFCMYGTEIFIFRTITHTIIEGWGWDKGLVIVLLMMFVLIIGQGGLQLVGKVSSVVVPLFLVVFASMSIYILAINILIIPSIFKTIFISAWTPHAAIGAFAGSTMMTTMTHGVKRACYSGDIGIGYASTIHSQTAETSPSREACMGIMSIFMDTFIICTLSLLLILVTGTWKDGLHETVLVAQALQLYFPFINIFWPMFIFLLGYTTLISFYSVGKNAAVFLLGDKGNVVYPIFAAIAFVACSYIGENVHAMMFMAIVGMFLLILNLYGIIMLSDKIKFSLTKE